MLDWDDVRYFLAVAREGSVRAASERLGVNHSTVLRRLAQFEERLGAILFDRLPSGYRLTVAGEEVVSFAEQMETASNGLQSRVLGRDQGVRGLLRVTMPATVATHLLMPDFGEFARAYPAIEVEIYSSDEPLNLTNRQADIALRVVYDDSALPTNLYALKGPEIFGGVYMSRALLAASRAGGTQTLRWIRKDFDGLPDWGRVHEVRIADVPFRTPDAATHIAAVRQGIGISTLPCFVGDVDPDLVRVPGSSIHKYGTLWILTHGETRKTKRVRLFTDLIGQKLRAYAPRLRGLVGAAT